MGRSLQFDLPDWAPRVFFVFLIVLMAGCAIGMAQALYMRRRNDAVHAFRVGLLHVICVAMKMDENLGRDGSWRMEVFTSVTYDDMMKKFWLPLDAFYPDQSFLTPPQRSKESDDGKGVSG